MSKGRTKTQKKTPKQGKAPKQGKQLKHRSTFPLFSSGNKAGLHFPTAENR